MTPEQHRQLNFLASMPSGHTTMAHDDLKAILLETGGNMLACGRLYDIVGKPIGAGVYKVTLALTHPLNGTSGDNSEQGSDEVKT